MIRFLTGFVLGVYITQNYNVPNLHENFKKLEEEFKRKTE